MMRFSNKWVVTAALVSSMFSGCDDPADDVAAATVIEETETPEASEETPAEETPTEAADTQTLAFSNEGSSIAFIGSKADGSSHEGGFNEFVGSIEFNAASPMASQIQLTIQSASLFADDPRLTEHLKSDEFFDVAAHPTATFETTELSEGGEGEATHTIVGRLTLHGQTQTLRIPATVEIGDSEVHATSEFSIDRSDFGITYPGQAENLIRERVVVKFDIRAPRG